MVEVDRRHVRYDARYRDILAAEVEFWLRGNVRRGRWRFAKKIGLRGMPTPEDPCLIIASIQIIFQIHLANEDDAFAFKMRWL